ncbi:MAG: PEGA domain-containing protein [Candidatus Omnitrophota bacterium]|nr:PEGA domain-containing protein [Candidatus Omnitrophota bacterium]
MANKNKIVKIKRIGLFVFLAAVLSSAPGCVKRIVTIDSQPSGAEVSFGRKTVGTTPCNFDFTFYGSYPVKLTKEGYKDFYAAAKLKPPFYEWIPLDFVSELLLPVQFKDVHSFTYRLFPEEPFEFEEE